MADLRLERVLWRHRFRVIGVDEAGRGPLAGPVVAAACILPADASLPLVNDSKKLTEKRREAAFIQVQQVALGWGVGIVDAGRIDQINILKATFEAMTRAVAAAQAMAEERAAQAMAEERAAQAALLWPDPAGTPAIDCLLVDGNAALPSWTGSQRPVVGGDRKSLSVAAASVLAKVTRDRLMVEYDRLYPGYGFAKHKGYGAREHIAAIDRLGPSPIHRMSFIDHRQLRFF